MDYVLSGTIKHQDARAKSLVEIGVAFFCKEGSTATIMEPIAIYSLVNFFKSRGQTVGTYLNTLLTSARGYSCGNVFEEIIAWNFFTAFSSGRELRAVFHFCGTPPEWSEECAQLLSISIENNTVHSTPITTQCAFPFALKAKHETTALDWASNPMGIPILFPDNYCGPDIIMVLETVQTKQRIVVCVQTKFTTEGNISLEKALETVNPEKMYMVKVCFFLFSSFSLHHFS
jgi:hypothetical protein